MATTSMQHPPTKRGNIVRLIAIVSLSLIVLVGVAVLITWLVVKPKRLQYTIEDPKVHGYSLNGNHLNGTFEFVIRAYNPNSRISIYYDSIHVQLGYDHQTVAFSTLEPFRQPHRNMTRLDAKVVAQNVALATSSAKEMKHERSTEKIEFDVFVKARIRFKVGIWKSKHRTLKITCSPVIMNFSSSKSNFETSFCEEES